MKENNKIININDFPELLENQYLDKELTQLKEHIVVNNLLAENGILIEFIKSIHTFKKGENPRCKEKGYSIVDCVIITPEIFRASLNSCACFFAACPISAGITKIVSVG